MSKGHVEPQAWYDVIDIAEYLGEATRSSSAGESLLDEFHRKLDAYSRQPEMGDLRDDLGPGLRSFTFRRWYVAIYRPLDDGINVLRVFDARSKYHRHLGE